MNRIPITNWLMLAYFTVLVTSHMLIVATWWVGLFNDWRVLVTLADIGEQWVEGFIWNMAIIGLPFATYWLYRRLPRS